MALSEEIPGDLSKVKQKVALNLTARQLVCFGIGFAAAIPVFFVVKKPLGMEMGAFTCMLVCIPFFILGMYEKNGLSAEKIFFFAFRQKYLRVAKRPKVVITKQEEIERMESVRKEIEELESKAKGNIKG
ncbi:MAG: PrgI family protein [Lachnospiraceae bacterium]|nr:PrgI family protein [Lachnospiraceae bacterium]